MRILVTGSTGLLGTNLMNRLKGHEVLGLSRKTGFDLRNKEVTKSVIEDFKPEVVYHLAANAAEMRGQVSPIDMTERNLNIFLHVLVPSINTGVKRFIYTSSVAVYGEAEVPYREDDIPKPKDIYGINKWAAEQMLVTLARSRGMEYTIFRPHNIYGPYQDMSNPYKNVVALFMRNIIEGKPITIYGEGKMRRAFSYVDDVVDVLSQAQSEAFKNQVFNVGSAIDYGIDDLLSMIETISGKTAIVDRKPARPTEIYQFLPSHTKLSNVYEYHETPLSEGLQKTWDFITMPKIKEEENEICI